MERLAEDCLATKIVQNVTIYESIRDMRGFRVWLVKIFARGPFRIA